MASDEGRILLPPRHAPLPNGGVRLYLPKPVAGAITRAKKGAKHEYRNVFSKFFGNIKVHQAVCEAFHGPKPFPEAVVIHRDEDGLNNREDNLKWGTQKENLNAPGFIAYCRSPERTARLKRAA
ncbi:MAG: HNH endonuclease signature motif containing protein [Pseudomonadota bacterium]